MISGLHVYKFLVYGHRFKIRFRVRDILVTITKTIIKMIASS